ncbi:uncharacterized protein TrAFT101_007904 [Trichoderma asperellum]|uniref:uncharacterized protein n=1 Tax=Trichoderma asperellum TaxID=101201 RepID=UPI00332880AB|nr:hypothetical protein TrAFT101_007904 [Trichoderma asperellum]
MRPCTAIKNLPHRLTVKFIAPRISPGIDPGTAALKSVQPTSTKADFSKLKRLHSLESHLPMILSRLRFDIGVDLIGDRMLVMLLHHPPCFSMLVSSLRSRDAKYYTRHQQHHFE